MEDPLGSIFNSHHESDDELKQKLRLTRIELETLRTENVELVNLLNMAQQERDEARNHLQKMMKALTMMNNNNNNLVTVAAITNTKANSSITESNSLSRVSSPVEAVSSSPEFSNMNNVVVDSGSCFFYEKPDLDPADALIECLAKGKVLPQQGKLLDAVVAAGPLLQSLIPAGPLPTFRNPPPLLDIKVPPLAVKGFDSNGIIDLGSSFQTTTTNNCSWNSPSSVLNFGGGSWNNVLPLTSNVSGVMNFAPSRIVRQRI